MLRWYQTNNMKRAFEASALHQRKPKDYSHIISKSDLRPHLQQTTYENIDQSITYVAPLRRHFKLNYLPLERYTYIASYN